MKAESALVQDGKSFSLFVEGLRALQCYGHESARDEPRKPLLDWFLAQAIARLRENVSCYPDDLLPRYYLGVAVTTLNQHRYVEKLHGIGAAVVASGRRLGLLDRPPGESPDETAKELGKTNAAAREYRDLDLEPWPLLHEADFHFQKLEDKLAHGLASDAVARAALLRSVTFNRAEVYSRLNRSFESDLEKALHLLLNIPSAKHPEASTLQALRLRAQGSSPEQYGPRELSSNETKALDLQCQTLQYSSRARIGLQKDPPDTSGVRALEEHEAEIRKASLPERQQADVEADYYGKRGYVLYKIAIGPNASLSKPRLVALEEAEIEFHKALRLKPNWNPAQIYLATAYLVHSGLADGMGNDIDKERFASRARAVFKGLLGGPAKPPAPATGQWQVKGLVTASPTVSASEESP